MRYQNFRNFRITKTCSKTLKPYQAYKPYLKKDFHDRCAYCNTLDFIIAPLPYHIDHYIPKKIFNSKRPELETNYDNLMYSCPKCNRKKGDLYKGDITVEKIENELFYNPVEVDYNEVFYRDEYGTINSEDEKGRNMINLLELYKPIYNITWLLDEILTTKQKIENKLTQNIKQEVRQKLEDALRQLKDYYFEVESVFKSNYYNKNYYL